MAIYEYRCDQDGLFEVTRPLGTAPELATCSVCGREARRVFSVGMVKRGSNSALVAAMDHAEKSRHEPDVVTSLPSSSAGRRTLSMTPELRRLPRP